MKKIFVNKNWESYRNAIEGHRQRARCERLLQAQKEKIKDFGEWLLNYIPPKLKVVDKVLESFKNKPEKMYDKRDTLFQPTQSKSALKNFAIQREIKWLDGYDPESFLLNFMQPITNLMINTLQTKVKLIL